VDKQNTDVLKEIYDKVMMEKTGMTGEEYEEYQQIQFHNERNTDVAIKCINNTLERINIKLDKLIDTVNICVYLR
jgi:arginyl-tRNA synthetase